jgi:rubrerythrin
MEKELTVEEIIEMAIVGENEAAQFYGKMAKTMKNELVRAKYESLAREEIGHKELLTNIYKKLTGSDYHPTPDTVNHKTAEGAIPVAITDSIEKALNFAIAREQEAREFYSKAARKTKDESKRRILEYLADIEHGHEQLLKEELKAYKRDKKWYTEQPIQLVGP